MTRRARNARGSVSVTLFGHTSMAAPVFGSTLGVSSQSTRRNDPSDLGEQQALEVARRRRRRRRSSVRRAPAPAALSSSSFMSALNWRHAGFSSPSAVEQAHRRAFVGAVIGELIDERAHDAGLQVQHEHARDVPRLDFRRHRARRRTVAQVTRLGAHDGLVAGDAAHLAQRVGQRAVIPRVARRRAAAAVTLGRRD